MPPAACPWCQTPTTVDRPRTRALLVGGREVGELCPPCTAESRELDAMARADVEAGWGDSPW